MRLRQRHRSPRRMLALALLALGGTAAGAGPEGASTGPEVSIREPASRRPVAGTVLLAAEVRPGDAAIERLVFRIDGERVAVRESPPWEATWDAGLDYEGHVLEVTVVDQQGRSVTARRDIPPILLREHITVMDAPMEEVQLSVTVTDSDGESVPDLKAEDFLVTENGRPQTLSDFGREGDREDRPLSILLIVDRSSSMRAHLKQLGTAVATLVGAIRPQDEAAVATLVGGEFKVLQPFVGAGAPLEPALDELRTVGGSTPLFYAIEKGLDLTRDRAGRRVILVLTDGWDDRLRLNVNFFQNNQLMDLARRAQRTNTQITLIWPGPPSQGKLAIESLVEETGGLVYYTSSDMAELLRRIARHLLDQYFLAYYSDDPARDGRRRRIDVRVIRPDVKAWTIGGFFALPPQLVVLRSEIRDGDPQVRADAARALGYLDAPEAVPLLRSALKDNDPEVRAEAARGLGRRGDTKAIPALVRSLASDSSALRTAAHDALESIGQPATSEMLERLPRVDTPTRVLLLRLLGEVGDDRCLEPIAARLASELPEERLAAARALGRLGLSGAFVPLERALGDGDVRVRGSAIRAIGEIGGQAAVRILEGYGGREVDPDLRHLAADALASVLQRIRGSRAP